MRRLIEPSQLDLCCLQKPIIIDCGSERVKEFCSFCQFISSRNQHIMIKSVSSLNQTTLVITIYFKISLFSLKIIRQNIFKKIKFAFFEVTKIEATLHSSYWNLSGFSLIYHTCHAATVRLSLQFTLLYNCHIYPEYSAIRPNQTDLTVPKLFSFQSLIFRFITRGVLEWGNGVAGLLKC